MSPFQQTPQVFLLDREPEPLAAELERAGFQVEASASWSALARALLHVRGEGRAILVCDLVQDGIRGLDFCRSTLKYDSTLRIVLFSSESAGETDEAARHLGGAPWALKRDGVERLVDLVREAQALPAQLRRPTAAWLLGRCLEAAIAIGDQPLVLGRETDCEVVLRCDLVSRHHASLRVRGDKVEVCDLGSSNGVLLDDVPVPEVAQVERDAELQIGTLTLLLRFELTERLAQRAQRALNDTVRARRPMRNAATTTARLPLSPLP